MWRFRVMASRVRGLFARDRADSELRREIDEHVRLLVERNMRQGMSAKDAERAARRQFGGIAQLEEEHRETRGIPFLENLLRDLLYAFRTIRASPAFSLMVVGILAVGLGATTAIFSLVYGILLRPLPFPRPSKLVALYERDVIANGDAYSSVAPAAYLDWRKQATTLDGIAAISYARLNLSGAAESAAPERIDACACSATLFPTLGVPPLLGRAYTPEEDRGGGRALCDFAAECGPADSQFRPPDVHRSRSSDVSPPDPESLASRLALPRTGAGIGLSEGTGFAFTEPPRHSRRRSRELQSRDSAGLLSRQYFRNREPALAIRTSYRRAISRGRSRLLPRGGNPDS
jgi:hypothetical protein